MEKADLPNVLLATYFRKDRLFLPLGASFRSHVLRQPGMQVRPVLPPREVTTGWYKMPCLGNQWQMSEKGMMEHWPPQGADQGSKLVNTQQRGRSRVGRATCPCSRCSRGDLYLNEELVCKNSSCIASGYRCI